MQLPRRKQRELLLQLLFSWEVANLSTTLMMETLEVSKKNVLEMEAKLQKLIERKDEIDQILIKSSFSYSLERVSLVDKNILRIALFELLFEREEPRIVIEEALRLSKKFSSPEAVSYVHAVIDEVNKNEVVPV